VQVKPRGEEHDRRLGVSIVYSCELSDNDASSYDYLDDDEDDGDRPVFQWIGPTKKEITEQSGRCFVEDVERGMKLFILKIELEDAGVYTCRIKHKNETVEKSVKLVLYQDIGFENITELQHPVEHTDALIHCKVTGKPVPQVSWKYKGKRLRLIGRYQKKANGLLVKNITQEDDGQYTCRAEVDDDGRYDERIITVDVYVLPKITKTLGDSQVVLGNNVSLSCQAEGNPLPTFSFYKKETRLVNTDTVRVNEKDGVLYFHSVNKSDEGTYTCTAANVVGHTSNDGKLKVLVPPTIFEWSNTSVEEDQVLTMLCEAHGDPDPDLYFSRNGIIYSAQNASNDSNVVVVSMDPGELMLQIDSVSLEDAGVYSCSASNQVGYHELDATVTVFYKPRPSNHNDLEVYSWAGATHNLTCQTFGLPTPTIQWKRWGKELTDNSSYRVFTASDENSTTSHLQVSVRQSDVQWIFGEPEYICNAVNLVGESTAEFQLKLATEPESPEGVILVERMADALTLEIVPPIKDGGVPVLSYSIEYSEKAKVHNDTISSHHNGTAMEEDENEDNTTGSVVRLKIDNQTDKHSDLHSTDTHNKTDKESDVNSTRIDNQTKKDILPKTASHTIEFVGNQTTIHNLKPETCYLLKIRARNAVGSGPEYETSAKTDKQSPPGRIVITSDVHSVHEHKFIITWQVNSTGGLPILEYQFNYTKVNPSVGSAGHNPSEPSSWTVRVLKVLPGNEDGKIFVLSDLSPDSAYLLNMRARNTAGWSAPTPHFKFTTATLVTRKTDIVLPPLHRSTGSRTSLSTQALAFSLVSALLAMAQFLGSFKC